MTLPTVLQSALDVKPITNNYQLRFMNPGELEVIVALVRSVKPMHVLEIGVNIGRTARVILDNVPDIDQYVGIDVTPGYVTSKLVQRNEVPSSEAVGVYAKADRRFELVLRPRGSLDLTPSDLQPVDVCFIDGDHGKEAVEYDTALARCLVRRGGIIIWHDYHNNPVVDVKQVLDSMQRSGSMIYHVAGTWIAFERVP